jgi:hypothetical protein
MTRLSKRAIPFVALGVTFLAVGASGPGRRAFVALGVVFIALGVALTLRRKRG